MYSKILRTCNVQQMDIFHSKLVSSTLSVTNTFSLTNTLAYYEIRKLQTRNVLNSTFPWYRLYTTFW
jgi:hypothetical protein